MYACGCVHRTYIDSKLDRQIDRCLHAYVHMHMYTYCVCVCVCVCVCACVRACAHASGAQRIDHVDEWIPLLLGFLERFDYRIDVRDPFVLDPLVVCP